MVAGDTYGSFEVLLTVTLLVGVSATRVADLEALIEGTLANTGDWSLKGVDEPTEFVESGMSLLGTIVHIGKIGKL